MATFNLELLSQIYDKGMQTNVNLHSDPYTYVIFAM